jgi:hypothetical protein
MAYTDIDKSDDYFNVLLYTGTGSNLTLSGMDFQADWVWVKRRNTSAGHKTADVLRGFGASGKVLSQSSTSSEITQDLIESFTSDGYVVGTDSSDFNTSGGTYVTWNWLAGGTGVSNTNGSITSTVSANTTSGFSVVSFTGNGSSAQTVGHGLNSAPEIIITKNRIDATAWQVGSDYLTSWSYYVRLNTTAAQSSTGGGQVYGTAPTSTVFTVGNDNAVNGSSDGIISYCFHSVKGFSKIGSYTGNGSTNGTFVYTGFKPAWVVAKRTSGTGSWRMWDNKREGYNGDNAFLYANLTNAEESDGTLVDFCSQGFKWRGSSADMNGSGSSYIYMAFAENPFVTSTGIPACAR